MRKYWKVIKNTWEEMITYRLNFAMWRARVVFQTLTLYFLWSAILPSGVTLLGYSQSLMLTYVLGASFVGSIVTSSRSGSIGDEINQGNLSNFLLRPMNYFLYWFSKDLGDKAMNISFSIVELFLLFLILKPPIFIQSEPVYLALFLMSLISAVVIYFFINVIIGMIGFWSPEIWGPRFIFTILISFFAGGLFPLDILPRNIFLFFQYLPFSYLLYFPLKIYLGQIPILEIILGITVSFFWSIILYLTMKKIWNKGLRVYSAQGG
ncbi:MAG: ABC-2 family transporter protein [Candidatus Levybacteria bacterium]|nr:ABC-2 family transporter protein [Candidatus Levybacteria bacterium]